MQTNSRACHFKKMLYYFFCDHKLMLGLLWLLFLLVACASMLRPMAIGYLFKQQMNCFITVLMVLNVLFLLFSFVRARVYTRFEIKVIGQAQTAVIQHLLRLPVSFFDGYVIGDLVQRVLCINTLRSFFSMEQLGGLFSFLSVLISFSLLCYINWQLTALFLFFAVLIMSSAVLSAASLAPHAEQHVNELSQAYGFLLQTIQGISRIKLFARQQKIIEFWHVQYTTLRVQLQKNYDKGVLGYAFFNSIPMLLLFGFFVLSSWPGHSMLMPQLVLFLCCLLILINGMAPFCLGIGSLVLDTFIAYKRIRPIVDAPIEHRQDVSVVIDVIKDIRFCNVHFSYTDASKTLLRGVNCHIIQGEHVAFVGLSGSGKSTLLKLLLGFYTPVEGMIAINDMPLSRINLSTIRPKMGVVLQDEQLMPGTILENMIGYSTAQESDVWRILQQLKMSDFIASLPMGINTVVSTALPLLSGGQKQLLLIARALISNPQVLLLDEATNSLDNATQALISICINQLKITRITIAHHLATIRHADRIYVLEQGLISQEGTYEQLVQQDGLFYQLAKSQGAPMVNKS